MGPLRLRILSAPAGVQLPPLPALAGAGTIGRSEGNALVLPDPSVQVSRQHCRLEPTADGWQVVDLSSNGTFVNDMLVGRGNVRPLAPGDRLRLADWTLAVEGEPAGPAAAFPAAAPAAGDPLDPFGVADLSRAQPAAPVQAPLPPRLDRPDPLFGSVADPFGAAASSNPFAAPGTPPADPFGPSAPDPFAAIAPTPPAFPALDPHAPFGAPAPPPTPVAPPIPDVPSPLAGGLEQMAVPLPAPSGAPAGGGLPEDWMDEALAGLAPKPPARDPLPPPSPAPPAAPPPPPPPAAPVPGEGDAAGGLAAFARGAGITLPGGIAAETGLLELGRANRLLARSLMRLLAARRAVKSEFRISQTVVGARENNPLKFSADEAEMVALLLGLARPGFQAGSVAVADACRDLEAHQMALLAAFRAVIAQIFARLDPQVIGGKEDDAGFLGRLTGSGKSSAWDEYVKAYADLKQDFSESLRGRLAQVFAEAYESESRRLGGS